MSMFCEKKKTKCLCKTFTNDVIQVNSKCLKTGSHFSHQNILNEKLHFGGVFFAHPVYINDLPEALNETGSYLYVDYTCILHQDKDVEKIEFSSLCELFIDNKLSIHFGVDKAKKNSFK